MLYIVLIVIAVVGFVRQFLQSREIRRLSNILKDALDTERKLTTTFGNRAIEELCESVNDKVDALNESVIAAQNREVRLRAGIANISHDLRTPLTAILGYLELLKINPKKTAEYTEIVEDRANVLCELVETFYELSVADDENRPLSLEKIDANAILTNCVLGCYAMFEKRGIKPNFSVPDAPLYVVGNSLAFERVCQNLIHNALKYADDRVDISLEKLEDKCILSVRNTASGITTDDIPRLFDRFYTADKSRSGGNTGIGLYLVKVLLEKMGGRVVGAELADGVFSVKICLRCG